MIVGYTQQGSDMVFAHQRRPSHVRISAVTFGIVKHRQQFRVLIRQPGAGRRAKPIYLGLFATAFEARRARDGWLLANVRDAADVYPWLRGKLPASRLGAC